MSKRFIQITPVSRGTDKVESPMYVTPEVVETIQESIEGGVSGSRLRLKGYDLSVYVIESPEEILKRIRSADGEVSVKNMLQKIDEMYGVNPDEPKTGF